MADNTVENLRSSGPAKRLRVVKDKNVLCDEFLGLRAQIKILEAEKKDLAPLLDHLIPKGQDQETFPYTDAQGNDGEYIVMRVTQDRRQPDNDILTRELHAAGIPDKDSMMLVPDPNKVAVLLEAGELDVAAFGRSMVGAMVSYIDVRTRKK